MDESYTALTLRWFFESPRPEGLFGSIIHSSRYIAARIRVGWPMQGMEGALVYEAALERQVAGPWMGDSGALWVLPASFRLSKFSGNCKTDGQSSTPIRRSGSALEKPCRTILKTFRCTMPNGVPRLATLVRGVM